MKNEIGNYLWIVIAIPSIIYVMMWGMYVLAHQFYSFTQLEDVLFVCVSLMSYIGLLYGHAKIMEN